VLTAASAGHAGDQLMVVASVVVGLHHWLERCRSLPYVRAARNLETRGFAVCVRLPLVGRWQIKLGRSGDAAQRIGFGGARCPALLPAAADERSARGRRLNLGP
jgi:hypothetical protein